MVGTWFGVCWVKFAMWEHGLAGVTYRASDMVGERVRGPIRLSDSSESTTILGCGLKTHIWSDDQMAIWRRLSCCDADHSFTPFSELQIFGTKQVDISTRTNLL